MANPSAAVSFRRPTITHVIFDMNGLLLDTEKFSAEVQDIILARYDKPFDWSVKVKMLGRRAIEAAKIFVEESGISDSLTAEQFLVEREQMLQKYCFQLASLCQVYGMEWSRTGGASRLPKHLHSKGVPIALATGSPSQHYELKTQKHGEIFSLMHHVVLGDDPEVEEGKPSPDVFLTAARRFQSGAVDPCKILVFEDSPSGVLGAKNAGMSVVMVPDPRLDRCFYNVADQVLNSLLDFNPSAWGLPPFEDNGS